MNISKIIFALLLIISFWRLAFMWDMEFLLHYILGLSGILQLEEIIWFVTEHLDAESSEHFDDFFKTIHRNTSITQMVFTNNPEARITDTTSKLSYMGLVMTNGSTDPIMSLHSHVLLERHSQLNIIILVKPLADVEEAERLLKFLHERNFINSLLYVKYLNGSSDLLGLMPYPGFAFKSRLNILSSLKKRLRNLELGYIDCQGHKFSTPMRLDFPEVFPYTNEQGRTEVFGKSLNILKLFMEKINAKLEPYEMPKDKLGGIVVNMKEVLELIRSRKILISAHAYALFHPTEKIFRSNAMLLAKWCLMVPVRNTASTFYYPVLPFEKPVWLMLLLIYTALIITDGLWLWWERQHNPQPRSNLLQKLQYSLTNNFVYLLFITAWKHIKLPSNIKFVLYATVFFHAFFISSHYSALLGSFLTVRLFKDEINDMNDLIRANLTTMIIDYEFEFLLKENLSLPAEFLKLIKPVDPATFYLHQSVFNQSYAYFVCEQQWTFLRQQQAYLKPGLFKMSDICFGNFKLGFPMEMDSPIYGGLNKFILRLRAAGLLFHFDTVLFAKALRTGYMQRFKPNTEYQAADLRHLSIVFLMLIVFSGISILVFLAECFHYRFNKKTLKCMLKNKVRN